MNFNSDGYLDAGLHDMDVEGIVEHFVTAFPASNTRRAIIEGYIRHRSEFSALGVACVQLIDGSFVSNKADPGDIDLVAFADLDTIDALSPEDQKKLADLFSGPATKATHFCDAYFSPTVPENHPLYSQLRSKRKYWMGEFGYDREDRPKGVVRTQIDPAANSTKAEDLNNV
ncbi:hypothetical protein [Sediminicoccus sp. KRV36]|uniref:DUF6932 family protein n=1 Tax=Sediminicoccus sp. KRV36 TaxID=3133721 RepID=UPI00200E386E|nr:hypothetical protein [Sediminicoccus rosea]UPY36151.1 hypothetical protein LHU95_18315 [Sediminicoccus rosea]